MSPITDARPRRWAVRMAIAVAVAVAIVRFGAALRSSGAATQGDFYNTLPGAYVERINPQLWNSPDLSNGAGFHRAFYLYGPAQYLTLYPIGYLASYAHITALLLVVYGGVIAATLFVLWQTMRAIEEPPPVGALSAVCASLLFLPLIQSYVQREFEIVMFFAMCLGTYALVTGRRFVGGLLFGYSVWFKLLPIAFIGLFGLRRWIRTVAGFCAASAIVLAAAHLALGLDRFVLFNPAAAPASAITGEFVKSALLPLVSGQPSYFVSTITPQGYAHEGTGFCDRWEELNETMVSVRWALCGLNYSHRWLPSRELFFAFAAALTALCGWLFWRHTREQYTPTQDKWRTLWEISLVLFACTLLVRAHYYYQIVLLLPLTALLYRYWTYEAAPAKPVLLILSYSLLNALVVPPSVLSALFRMNFWSLYMQHQVYLYGQLILIALVLWEYRPSSLRVARRGLA